MEHLREIHKIGIKKFEYNENLAIAGKCMAGLRILLILSGCGVLEIDEQHYMIESSAAVLIPSNQSYLIRKDAHSMVGLEIDLPTTIYEYFEVRDFRQAMQWIMKNANGKPLNVDKRVEKYMHILMDELEDTCSYNRLNLIEIIIMELLRVNNKNADVLEETVQIEVKVSQLIKNIVKYINENYNKDIHLSNIAKEFWVNPSYLSREFKNKLGVTITNFILERKIYAAQSLLLTTDEQVSEIARIVGFKSIAYFNVVFKRINGVAPSEFRKKKRTDVGTFVNLPKAVVKEGNYEN